MSSAQSALESFQRKARGRSIGLAVYPQALSKAHNAHLTCISFYLFVPKLDVDETPFGMTIILECNPEQPTSHISPMYALGYLNPFDFTPDKTFVEASDGLYIAGGPSALSVLFHFLDMARFDTVWSEDADTHFSQIKHYLTAQGYGAKWDFRKERCVVTLAAMVGGKLDKQNTMYRANAGVFIADKVNNCYRQPKFRGDEVNPDTITARRIGPTKHAMIDIETLHSGPDAEMCQVGVCLLNSLEAEPYAVLQLYLEQPYDAKHKVSVDTIKWWHEVGGAGYAYGPSIAASSWLRNHGAIVRTQLDLQYVTNFLSVYLESNEIEYVWCKGKSFDFPVIANVYHSLGFNAPWEGDNGPTPLCYRTFLDVIGEKGPKHETLGHVGSIDAYVQGKHLLASMKKYNIGTPLQ